MLFQRMGIQCIHEGGNVSQIGLDCYCATSLLFKEKFTPEILSREFITFGEFDLFQTTTSGNSFAPTGRDT